MLTAHEKPPESAPILILGTFSARHAAFLCIYWQSAVWVEVRYGWKCGIGGRGSGASHRKFFEDGVLLLLVTVQWLV